ncbi:MAG: type I-U CRISPR-associated RAMP protein Csb1/Cas7u [Syntrophobacteraceae bacterium]
MTAELSFEMLRSAVAGTAAAFRCITEYEPVGGPGDKVFPPTYEGGKYAVETRIIDGEPVQCVLLDSVQSQANRMELALLEARRAKRVDLPLVCVNFDQEGLQKRFTISSLEAPHRLADAIFRDSMLDGVTFRKSEKGRILDNSDVRNATGLFGLCPTALIFGIWDSTGPRGGLGTKIQRALVSEIFGCRSHLGVKTSSRIDPAQISSRVTIYECKNEVRYTTDRDLAEKDKKGNPTLFGGRSGQGKAGSPSKANHCNIRPTIADGGVTITEAIQTTVLSLAALRRLRFPLNGAPDSDLTVDRTAQTALAALALYAATLAREEGADLRSRCQLFPVRAFSWELLAIPGQSHKEYSLDSAGAERIFIEALSEAKKVGLPWEGTINLVPSAELLSLVSKSQELIMEQVSEEVE